MLTYYLLSCGIWLALSLYILAYPPGEAREAVKELDKYADWEITATMVLLSLIWPLVFLSIIVGFILERERAK